MDFESMDLAHAATWFLAIGQASGPASLDPNTRRMFEALRGIVERYVYGGSSMVAKLNACDVLEDSTLVPLASEIRPVMRANTAFVAEAWDILQHNRPILRAMPNGPRLD